MKTNYVAKALRAIRNYGTFYLANQTPEFVESLRLYELNIALKFMPPEGSILEIGSGAGWQAKALNNLGYKIVAIDTPSSNLKESRIWPVIDYNGRTIPAKDKSFDIVYSSNVLEHIPHIYEFQNEIHRVLKPGGVAIHILPSSSWRFWSNITEVIKCWRLPHIHGEHAGNVLSEIYYFSRFSWSRLFKKTGWKLEKLSSTGLFYTGSSIMASRLSIDTRKKLSLILGGASNIYILRSQK